MKLKLALPALLVASATLAVGTKEYEDYNFVESNKLRHLLTRKNLFKHAVKLQQFADADPDKNRAFGGKGHQLTVDHIYNALNKYPEYYTVEKQQFVHEYSYGTSNFSAGKESYQSSYFTYSPPTKGDLKADLANTLNFGCNQTDYPAGIKGKIALVSRGACEFGLKSVLAGKAGAAAIIVYNNVPGSLPGGTFKNPVNKIGPYVPGAMISLNDGKVLKAHVEAGPVPAILNIDAVLQNRTTYNIIAQTKGGDQENVVVVGGHTDSVGAGPGINDNGSGTIGILEVALQLTKFCVKNAIRFGFWSAEEYGLIGSEYYVKSLSVAEQNRISLYLNFDMIASPNYAYFVYDSNSTALNTSVPIGSDEIKHLFVKYFLDIGWKTVLSPLDGRSDYGPFFDVGIPIGGLFTGAEDNKTEEQAAYYGGTAGKPYDANYHTSRDTIINLNMDAFLTNTKAIAHAVATYARSTKSIPPREKSNVKRTEFPQLRRDNHR